MATQPQFTAQVKDAPDIPGEGKPRRQIDHVDALTAGPDNLETLYQVFQHGLKQSEGGPMMGTRQVVNGVVGGYTWITYTEANKKIINLASGLSRRIGGLSKNTSIGLFSINRHEWVLAEHASFHQSYITVPLYDTLGDDAIEYIINQTEMPICFATADKAAVLLKMAAKLPTLKEIIVMDQFDGVLENMAKEMNISLVLMSAVEMEGQSNPIKANPPTTNDTATICYTSGTTGMPKGVVLSHLNIVSFSGSVIAMQNVGKMYTFTKNDVHISYLPLAHIFERVIQVHLMVYGASWGFYQGNSLLLLDDVGILKPTVFASVPRLYNRIYDKVLAGVKSKGGLAALLFAKALSSKKEGLKNGDLTHWLWDKLVFAKIREKLGGRVRMMITGAAPIAAEVVEFLRCAFSVNIIEGYGQTESAAALTITGWKDYSVGHIGAPMTCCEIKLVDVESMGYTSKSTPPKGEICFRGTNVFKEYYKLPEKTSETIDKDGYVHTGDIGSWDEQGRLKIIDRIKNIFKLAQGEYIAPEKIENVYARHPLIAQIFVYGESLQATLVAIVVPDPEVFPEWAKENGFVGDLKTLCVDAACTKAVLSEMTVFAKASDLKGFEHVKGILLHDDVFSVENQLLTPTFKLKRHEVQKLFQGKIDGMYKIINSV